MVYLEFICGLMTAIFVCLLLPTIARRADVELTTRVFYGLISGFAGAVSGLVMVAIADDAAMSGMKRLLWITGISGGISAALMLRLLFERE